MMVLGIGLLCLMSVYAAYLLHKAYWWHQIPQAPTESHPLPSISVVIAARNEEGQILQCLASIGSQTYPAHLLQCLVINDHSTDNTARRVEEYCSIDTRFNLISLGDGQSGKKAAIAKGITMANGTIIITTDADCIAGPDWLRTMVAYFTPEVQLVSGPVALTGAGAFAEMQSLEFSGLMAVGGSSMAAGMPNMCNGANLAYRKSAFEAVGGFTGIDGIASGDDELLMHKIAAQFPGNCRFAQAPAAVVNTPAMNSMADFARQRVRWVSKSTFYRNAWITATLVIIWFAMFFVVMALLAAMLYPELWKWVLAAILIKMGAEAAVLWGATRFLGRQRLMAWLPVEQVLHVIYVIWVGVAGNWRKQYEWKGRKVK